MTNYFELPTWADSDHVHAVVETPRGSRAKLEFDPKLGAFTLAKPLLAGLTRARAIHDNGQLFVREPDRGHGQRAYARKWFVATGVRARGRSGSG